MSGSASQFGAQPLGTHRDLVGAELRGEALPPPVAEYGGAVHPFLVSRRVHVGERVEQPGEAGLGVGVQGNGIGVVPAELGRFDVDLHHSGLRRRDLPGEGQLTAGLAAHVHDHVGFQQYLVGARPGVQAGDTDVQPVVTGHSVLAVE